MRRSKRWLKLLDRINWGRINVGAANRNITRGVLHEIERALRHPNDRGCPVICVYHFKGGVGKTTLAAHLAAQLYLGTGAPKSVLMIDCDAQADLSSLFLSRKQLERLTIGSENLIGLLEPDRLHSDVQAFGPYELAGGIIDEMTAHQAKSILHRNHQANKHFAIVANSPEASKYSKVTSEENVGRFFQNFQHAIQYLSYQFDFIILDCNPSATMLSELASHAATDIVVPLRLDKFALDGLANIDRLLTDFYGLNYSCGRSDQTKQLWTVVNHARRDKIDESNEERAKGRDEEALQLAALIAGDLIGDRPITKFIPFLLNTRLPASGFLQPLAVATNPHGPDNNPAERLLSFRSNANAVRVSQALLRLANELIEKTKSQQPAVAI